MGTKVITLLPVLLSLGGDAKWTKGWFFAGFFLAALTSLCGPLLEIALINVGHLYSYGQPSFLGIPAWIGAVYFCGAPAVGNLGRKVQSTLMEQHKRRQ